MESVQKEKAALISGIETDARAEAQDIIKNAETRADEKKKYAEKKVASILDEARQKATEQAETVKSRALSAVELEVKRRTMHVRDAIMQDISRQVEQKLETRIHQADYRNVMVNWITEAAIGLDVESAVINASEKEKPMIDESVLSDATQKIQAKTGKQMTLTLSDALALKFHGIVLTASNGRTAFNNQVRTRMLRKQREIRMLIYNTLFADNRKETL